MYIYIYTSNGGNIMPPFDGGTDRLAVNPTPQT